MLFIAAGSVITAAATSPAWWVVPASAVACVVGVWADATWSQHRVWTAHHDEALQASAEDLAQYPAMAARLRATERRATSVRRLAVG